MFLNDISQQHFLPLSPSLQTTQDKTESYQPDQTFLDGAFAAEGHSWIQQMLPLRQKISIKCLQLQLTLTFENI